MRPRIRRRLPDIRLTIEENLGKITLGNQLKRESNILPNTTQNQQADGLPPVPQLESTVVAEGLVSLIPNPAIPGSIPDQDELPGSLYRRPPEAADSLDRPPWNVVQRSWMASAMAPEADLLGGGVSPRTDGGGPWWNFPKQEWILSADGATSHTARISMDAVNVLFPGRVISGNGDIAWPPRSPDLKACDFFLWGHLKTKVFGGNLRRTIPALKQRIREEVAAISVNMLRGVMQQFVARLEECVRFNGGYLADIIFKK
ncbi:hypothetical protein ANN_08029 [Periplaneta americana]|uniref:Uncharacterized protein n=1 Tax=Periplaneta americana TaxID=6978 RepID=A0ABQ8T095_PERAM|nr:hypothetical protein ANN_08029 [Periplaneta americana]